MDTEPAARHQVAQLILRGPERQTAVLDLLASREDASPLAFENIGAGVRVPRFGAAALLDAAVRAKEAGCEPTGIEFHTEESARLREQHEASRRVLEALTSSGPERAQGLLRHEFRDRLIIGVRFRSDVTGTIVLRRNGVLVGQDTSALRAFALAVLGMAADHASEVSP